MSGQVEFGPSESLSLVSHSIQLSFSTGPYSGDFIYFDSVGFSTSGDSFIPGSVPVGSWVGFSNIGGVCRVKPAAAPSLEGQETALASQQPLAATLLGSQETVGPSQSLQASTLLTVQVMIQSYEQALLDHWDLLCDIDSKLWDVLSHQEEVIMMQGPDAAGSSLSALQSMSVPADNFSAVADRFLAGQTQTCVCVEWGGVGWRILTV